MTTIPDVMTAAEVARIWGVEGSTIRQAIADGRLPARKADRRTWLVRREDAIAWRGEPGDPEARLNGSVGRPQT